MTVIDKPMAVSASLRCFERDRQAYLVTTQLVPFELTGERRIETEPTMWRAAGTELAHDVVLDEGMFKPCGEVLVCAPAGAGGRLVVKQGDEVLIDHRGDDLGPLPLQARQAIDAGHWDAAWLRTQFPGLPKEASWERYLFAPPAQRLKRYWSGDETVQLAVGDATIETPLPGICARVLLRLEGDTRDLRASLDTVVLLPGASLGILAFRTLCEVAEDDGADVLEAMFALEWIDRPKPPEHYETVRRNRRDKDYGHFYDLRDIDLLPEDVKHVSLIPDLNAVAPSLTQQNVERGMEAKRLEMRALYEEHGGDPDAHEGLREPTPRKGLPAADDLVDWMKAHEARIAQAEAELDEKRREAEENARALCEEHGLDYEQVLADGRAQGGGPPKLTVESEMRKLHEQLELAQNAGMSLPHVEAQLADPSLTERLARLREQLVDAYVEFGHHFPEPSAPEEERRQQLRHELLIALDAGESVAERDLTGADLSELDLSGRDLRGAFLERADLRGAKLNGANLERAVLVRACLDGASLRDAHLSGTNFGNASLVGTDCSGATMTDAVLEQADLSKAIFRGAELVGAALRGTQLDQTRFDDADLSGARFIDTDLLGMVAPGAKLERATFIQVDLSGVDLSGASIFDGTVIQSRLSGAQLAGADLRKLTVAADCFLDKADMTGAKLDKAAFVRVNLEGCTLQGASMNDALFQACNLREANAYRVVARGCTFDKVDLARANLTGADLLGCLIRKSQVGATRFTGANLFDADLYKVVGDTDTDFADALVDRLRFVQPDGGLRSFDA